MGDQLLALKFLMVAGLFCLGGCGKVPSGSQPSSGLGMKSSPGSGGMAVLPPASTGVSALPKEKLSEARSLAAGALVRIELSEVIDSGTESTVHYVNAQVSENVAGPDGGVAIPGGSIALVVMRDVGFKSTRPYLVLGLNRILVGDRTIKSENGVKDIATLTFGDDVAPGPGNRSIHLQYRSVLNFKLEAPVKLY